MAAGDKYDGFFLEPPNRTIPCRKVVLAANEEGKVRLELLGKGSGIYDEGDVVWFRNYVAVEADDGDWELRLRRKL